MSKCRECGKPVSTLAKTCPNCGVPKPVKKTINKIKKKKKIKTHQSTKNKKINKISLEKKETSSEDLELGKIWAHCRNYKCKDYTQMLIIYKSYLNIDRCNVCNSALMEPKISNGKPIMPTDGVYGKKKFSSKTYFADNEITKTKGSGTEKDVFGKFYDGELDLATAFWGFGIFGSFIVGFVFALLAESVGKLFYVPYAVITAGIIFALWECAENYNKEKIRKKESPVWGYLTQIFCGFGAVGLIANIYDIIKTL